MSASPSSASPPSMLAMLREATSSAHAALDSKLRMEHPSQQRYETFLRATYAILVELEPKLARWLGAAPDGTSRVAALQSDLAALGALLPAALPSPAVASVAEAVGAAYVVEGSALGGLVIARGLPSEWPRCYLTLRGDRTGPAWRDVVGRIETWGLGASPSARANACDSARATFAAYANAFDAMGAFAT